MRRFKLQWITLLILTIGAALGIAKYAQHASISMDTEIGSTDICPMLDKYPASESKILWTGAASRMGVPAPKNGPIVHQNFIDDYIFGKMDDEGVPYTGLSSDEEFIRRIHLDLTGRIPSAQVVRDFLADTSEDKRNQTIDELLASDEFVDKLTLFLGDLLGTNPGNGVGVTGRTKYYNYLKDFVAQNRTYDQLVKELITATGDGYQSGPANFVIRQYYDSAYNQPDKEDELANVTGSVFFGVPLMCINCHDGRGHVESVNQWLAEKKREELWGMAAFFSGVRFQRINDGGQNRFHFEIQQVENQGYNTYAGGGIRPSRRGRVPTQYVMPRDIFTGTEYELEDSRSTLTDLVVANPQFARATVNYIWAQLMNLGIVDPPGGFDLSRDDQASHPELLQALADEFVASGFDLKRMFEIIAKSSAYQLSVLYNGEWKEDYTTYFARHIAKRMDAEQVHDSIVTATGVLPNYQIAQTVEQRNNGNCQNVTVRVPYAVRFPDPTEPGCNADGGVRGFLNAFDRGNRLTVDRKKPPTGSIGQTLGLMNNNFVVSRIMSTTNGSLVRQLLDSKLDNDALIDELFLATLSRFPTDDERKAARSALGADRQQGAEHLHWALLNKLDFLFY